MRTIVCCSFLALLLSVYSCNRGPDILVDVKEVDFMNKSEIILEGKKVDIEVLGVGNMIIYDSLLMHSLLYGLTEDEEVVIYDMSNVSVL